MTSGVFAEYGDPLTPQERDALIAYAYLGTTKAAADLLRINHKTLKHYLTSIYRKMGVKTGIQAWTLYLTTEGEPSWTPPSPSPEPPRASRSPALTT